MNKGSINISLLIVIFLVAIFYSQITTIHADSVTDPALLFLKSKQDVNGKIINGFSAPSQWAAIAFAVNGIDTSTIKYQDKSLTDFLITDIPTDPSAATDWENRILAIVAIGQDPTNFGGVNYVQKLESFYNNNQIGDSCSLNDDVFGLLALTAAGDSSTLQIKQDSLNFLIQNQGPDGGFSFSAPGCSWYQTSSDMTAAAIQAFKTTKDSGLVNDDSDNALIKSKEYLLTNQNPDGGFGYFGSSDSDTTGWVLMAFNVLGLQESEQAIKTQNWLKTQQSPENGGFLAFDYGTNTLVSNTTTTSQAIIALSGKSWVTKTFIQNSATPLATPTPSPTPLVTVSPSPVPTVTPTPSPSPVVTPLQTLVASPSPSATPQTSSIPISRQDPAGPTPASTVFPEVLGESKVSSSQPTTFIPQPEINQQSVRNTIKNVSLVILGVVSLFSLFKFLEERRWKR